MILPTLYSLGITLTLVAIGFKSVYLLCYVNTIDVREFAFTSDAH